MASGVETGKFGVWLSQRLHQTLGARGYRVFYDHGDKAKHPNVAAIQGFWGEEPSRMNRLADIDVVIVDDQNKVSILIEIEEGPSPPKKIIGDVFAISMCNHVAVTHHCGKEVFDITPATVLVVAGVVNPRGHKLAQIQQVILPRVNQFQAPAGGFSLHNTRFVFEANIEDTIRELKGLVLKELDSQNSVG